MPLSSDFVVFILLKAFFHATTFNFFGDNLVQGCVFDTTIYLHIWIFWCQFAQYIFWCHYLRSLWCYFLFKAVLLMPLSSDFLLAFVLSKVPLVDVTIFGFSMLILFGQRFCCHCLTVSWFEFCSRQFVWCSYLCFLLWGRLHKERKKTSLSDCLMSHGASAMSMYARFLCLMWWFVLLMIVLLLLWTACKAKIHAKNYSRTIENMVT